MILSLSIAVGGEPTARRLFVGVVGAVLLWLGISNIASRHEVVPSCRWMIPRAWEGYGPVRYGAAFGFNLGLGWRTRVHSNLWWVAILAGLGLGDVRVILV